MPGFPDAFAPFYKKPPGATVSAYSSRAVGSFIRPLRKITRGKNNLTAIWIKNNDVPSSWGQVDMPGPLTRAVHAFYKKLQYAGSKFKPDSERQQALQRSAFNYIGEDKRFLNKEEGV